MIPIANDSLFATLEARTHPSVEVGDSTYISVHIKGTSNATTVAFVKCSPLTLTDVQYVPVLKFNLLSDSRMQKKGLSITI